MATAKLFFDKRAMTKDNKCPLVIRVSHKGNRKDIDTHYKLLPSEWNDKKQEINTTYKNSKKANAKLKTKIGIAADVISNYERELTAMSVYDLANVIKDGLAEHTEIKLGVRISSNDSKKTTLKEYGRLVNEQTRKTRTIDYAKSELEAINIILKFHGNDKLLITEIDKTFLENFEAYYQKNMQQGDSINGLGVYLRSIRKIMNTAVKDKNTEVTAEHYSFGSHGYSIKKSTTPKRAIKLEEIEKIKNYKQTEYSPSWHHQNYFLFSFYMRGMNFIDIAFLKMSAIQDGRLVYRRRKTRRGENVKEFNIKINPDAQKILSYYTKEKNTNELVFPIMMGYEHIEDEERISNIYREKRKNHNKRLDTIAKALGINTKLTTYVARHSFATAGLHNGLSKAEIGDMLGHTNYYTTENYLAGFEQKTLDDAADKIFNAVEKG